MRNTTEKAYHTDLQRFIDWGGSVPSCPSVVAEYLLAHAGTHKYATLVRWKVSIGKAHTAQGLDAPTKSEAVSVALADIRQSYGKKQRKVARLTYEQTRAIVGAIDNRLKDKRDKALILTGASTGMRRAELTGLTVDKLSMVDDAITVKRDCHVSLLDHPAANALREWLSAANLKDGPVFQGINRHGQLSGSPLTGHGLALVIKDRVQAIGLDPAQYSGLSLCAGFRAGS